MAKNVANGIKLFASGLWMVVIVAGAPAQAAGSPEQPAAKVGPAAEAGKPAAAKADTTAKTPVTGADHAPAEVVVANGPSTEAQASVRKYCVNIAAAATDARFEWQSKKLLEVETRIKTRIAELDAKQAELKQLLDHREAIAKQAKDNLVGIYAKMKPETAAAQIAALDDEMATAVLAALTPRQASAVFNEITPPERAAKLASILANPSTPPTDKKL